MAIPTFFVVGAPKAGTTSLYHYLDQHPAVYMSPIKEPCFFAPEVVDFTPCSRALFEADAAALRAYLDGPMDERRRGIVLEWEQYLKLFKHVRDQTAVGEVSGNYLGSSGAPLAIRSRIPGALLVMMLRDPVDRLFSQYAAARAGGETRGAFLPWVAEQVSAEAARRPPFGPVWTGKYASHLQRYLEYFPRDQVRVYLYDDYARTPGTVLRDLLRFLGVDPDWPVETAHRHNVTRVPRWPMLHQLVGPVRRAIRPLIPARVAARARGWYLTRPRLRPGTEERARVIEIYQEDIRTLETLIQRDLSAWLDPGRSA
ncbi:MAG: sulfotransferase [Acidobacteria bacterium]|nr:sulfotransferase [Acidobacteriota bacterium]